MTWSNLSRRPFAWRKKPIEWSGAIEPALMPARVICGSMLPSNTIARTRSGKSCAYVDPSSDPYEIPQ